MSSQPEEKTQADLVNVICVGVKVLDDDNDDAMMVTIVTMMIEEQGARLKRDRVPRLRHSVSHQWLLLVV